MRRESEREREVRVLTEGGKVIRGGMPVLFVLVVLAVSIWPWGVLRVYVGCRAQNRENCTKFPIGRLKCVYAFGSALELHGQTLSRLGDMSFWGA